MINSVRFNAYGHPNVLGKHRNTLEFTKESALSLRGDCILGVKADFGLESIREFLEEKRKNNDCSLTIVITAGGMCQEIRAQINPDFSGKYEIVIRKSGFISERTLGIKADKACIDLPREFVDSLKKGSARIRVCLK